MGPKPKLNEDCQKRGSITEYRPVSVGSGGENGDSSCLGEFVPVSNKSSSSLVKEADMDVTQEGHHNSIATTETTDEGRGPLSAPPLKAKTCHGKQRWIENPDDGGT